MKHSRFNALVTLVAVIAVLGVTTLAVAQQGEVTKSLSARLKGFQEVPAISSTGSGELRLEISKDETSVDFELNYQDLEGTVTTAAHIHIGQKTANGGVMVFLCGGGGRPPCEPTSGTFTGTITAKDVLAVMPQGIAAGEFEEFLRALRAGKTYVNVHTNRHPGGEIRGQIK